ncbi:MAG: homocysteine S-methyltransferase family protein [Phycisphaerae bacterium]|nr:homocysteine S-methyltransferase family protein [Phycisphaerae bacterium]
MPSELPRRGATVTDGAWGTALDALGCEPGFCRERWNVERPDVVLRVAESYVAAGAQVILTNTFTANRIALDRHAASDRAEELNRAGAAISRRAAGNDVLVFGSIGPSGKIVMIDEIEPEELHDAFAEQSAALAVGGVDACLCESMTELIEALIAVRAAKETTGLPVVASMVFDSGPDRCFTSMGDGVEKVVAALADAGADVIGLNCGVGITEALRPAAKIRACADMPVWVKPNAGLPELVAGAVVYKETADDFAAEAAKLLNLGVNYIGGCCGTTPDHVRALVEIAKKHTSTRPQTGEST